MAIAPPPSLNGRPRKQLSDQLDRLDEVINGMEELLPQAVADAARDGIRQAFRDVLGELITDPAGLERLRTAVAGNGVPDAAKPSVWARLKTIVKSAASRVIAIASRAVHGITSAPRRLQQKINLAGVALKAGLAQAVLLALPVKTMVGSSLLIGLLVATLCYFAPHHVAAMVSGIGASFTMLGVQLTRWFRRLSCMA